MELTQTIELYCENHTLAVSVTPDNLLYKARDYALDHFNNDDRLIFMGAVAQKTYKQDPNHYGWSSAFANWPRLFPSGNLPVLWEMQTSEPAFITD